MDAVFLHDDFLLETDAARELYHNYARDLPIIDYHCHLPPEEIAADQTFGNLAQIWLQHDHYKWRVLRANGVAERYCTGDASDWEKFEMWAATVPKTLRNPIYHWTHMELKNPFGIADCLLGPETAESVWERANEKLADPAFSARGIMKQMNVVLVCTTDDPADSLEHHHAIAADKDFDIQVLPAWRPDRGIQVEHPARFNQWLDTLGEIAKVDIGTFDRYLDALNIRHDAFHQAGCRLSDHGLETTYAEDYTQSEIETIFERIRKGDALNVEQQNKFKSAMLYEFGLMDHAKGWTQQYHLGPVRSVNSRAFEKVGPDAGFDAMGEFEVARPLARFLDRLDRTDQLAKTIVYNMNPSQNIAIAAMIGCFQDGSVAGKMQYGSAWWYLDQLDGMTRQIEDLSNVGLLSRFVGMLTDSRSFLSYPRHEYFRRLLCNILGSEIDRGLLPNDLPMVGDLVRDVCFRNARDYFGFDLPAE